MSAEAAQVADLNNAALRLMADYTSDVVVQVSLDGRLMFVSPACRAWGYHPSDFVGMAMEEFIHPDDLAARVRNREKILATGSVDNLEKQFRLRTAKGDWVWVEGDPRLMFGADGKPVATICILRDITKVRAQSELFETAFRHAAIGMALVGLDGAFLKVNDAFCRLLGFSQAEMLAVDFQQITHPDDLGADLELLQRLTAGDLESYQMDKRYIRASGEAIWAHLTVSMVRHVDGAPHHYVAQVQDLTARRAAEAALKVSEARYRLIADNSSDMIVITKLTGEVAYMSPSVRQTGWQEADLIGKPFSDRMHPDDVKPVVRAFCGLLEGQAPTPVRWRGRHGVTNEWMWLESWPALLRDDETGEPTSFLDVIRDVTRQVRQEEALDLARRAASAAADAKSQFLANMSHEIRTPLTAVLGFTKLLAERDGLDSEARRFVERIGGAGRGLLSLVNDVLDFSKLEAGVFEIRSRPSDAAGICRETLEMFEPQAAAKGLDLLVRLDAQIPERVSLDSDRLRQVLMNLIGNAVKFTDQGSVTLRATFKPTSHKLRIEITDTGAGIGRAQRRSLFQRFTQVDNSATRRQGGTGLGLAICKGLVEAMGGRIGVHSKRGEGSTFFLELPAPQVALPHIAAGGAAQFASLDGVRILVVDDNALNREIARTLLQALGAEVQDADNGASAVKAAATAPFDVILMDLRMPDMTGNEALRHIRSGRGPNSDAPILAFTAGADGIDERNLCGFDGLIRKPMEVAELYRQITMAVEADGLTAPDQVAAQLA